MMKLNKTDVKIGQLIISPHRCILILLVMLVAYCLVGPILLKLELITWLAGDWLLISCLTVTIACVWLARNLGNRFETAMHRIWQRRALVSRESGEVIPQSLLHEITEKMQVTARRWSVIGGFIMLLAGSIPIYGEVKKHAPQIVPQDASLNAESEKITENKNQESTQIADLPKAADGNSEPKNKKKGGQLIWDMASIPIYMITGFITGLIIGRAVAYAFLGNLLHRETVGIKVMPGHPDGAAGMKPIGNLFFIQACLVMVPAIFMGSWYLATVLSPRPSEFWKSLQNNYEEPFLYFFLVLMSIEVFGFILPMWLFHEDMGQQKSELLNSADRLSERITDLKAKLVDTEDKDQRDLIGDELERASSRHADIESLPTWPVDIQLWRNFALGNLLLILPFLIEYGVKFIQSLVEPTAQ